MEEANLPEGVKEAICITVVAALRVEREARASNVAVVSGACGIEVATKAGGVGVASGAGGVGGDCGVIGQTGGTSSMRRGRSKSPSSRRRSRCGRSKSPSSRRRSWNGRSRSRGRSCQPNRRSSPSPSSSTSSSPFFDNHVSLSPPSRHHHRSPSCEGLCDRKQPYVDVMSDVKNLAYQPRFGGRNSKPKEVISFLFIVEDLFTNRYQKKDKIKAIVVLLKDKARVWFDTLKRDRENWGLGCIETWTLFKKLFLQQFLPGNFNSSMRQSMYQLRQGSMSITEFKFKFDEHVAYFPSWTENDRVEFFVEYLRDSIK
jgi:hypothetical protein